MNAVIRSITLPILAMAISASALLFVVGCTNEPAAPQSIAPTATPPTTMPAPQAADAPAPGQPVFDTDTDAVNALLAAVKSQNHDEVHRLLGPQWKELVSGDKAEDADAFKDFAARVAEKTHVEKVDDSAANLYVGNDNWRFPIPIVKTAQGKWYLDTEAGKAEILARRVGQDELDAIKICRLYVQAQRDYAGQDRDGGGITHYAERIVSSPGKTDGLWWPAAPGQQPSPMARLMSDENVDRHDQTPGKHTPVDGYLFRILKQQGPAAPGGQVSYIIDGKLSGGFALVAYPIKYRASGVMTFIINGDGKVYQKDLGSNTTQIARHMTEYNPDASWTLVTD